MSKRWWEVTIRCAAASTPVVLLRLKQFGVVGCAYENQESHRLLRIFLPLTMAHRELVRLALLIEQDAQQRDIPIPTVTLNQVDHCNATADWPITPVGQRLVVQPADIPYSGERLAIRLLPRFGFGTKHATTKLCLAALEDYIRPDDVIADIGCGSGVLSIAALLLGAAHAEAVDVDPVAADTACANRDINGIAADRMSVYAASVENLGEGPYDGILCNTGARILEQLVGRFSVLAKPGGWLLASGFRKSEIADMETLLERFGWKVRACSREEEWCALEAIYS